MRTNIPKKKLSVHKEIKGEQENPGTTTSHLSTLKSETFSSQMFLKLMSGVQFCTTAELIHMFPFLGLCSNFNMFSRFSETL